jgi:hypothetical protein
VINVVGQHRPKVVDRHDPAAQQQPNILEVSSDFLAALLLDSLEVAPGHKQGLRQPGAMAAHLR